MSVYWCPHCTSVAIVVGDRRLNDGVSVTSRAVSEKCPRVDCGGILDKLDEPNAGNVVRAAFYGHDHGFAQLAPGEQLNRAENIAHQLEALKVFNKSLESFAVALNKPDGKANALGPDEIGDAP
jgi:hypothetical protein